MIRSEIKKALSAIYALTVVEDVTQSKVERVIGFDLTAAPINIRHQAGATATFDVTFRIEYRCPAGEPSIGFLSLRLADPANIPPNTSITNVDGAETVEYITITEMVTSKLVNMTITLEYNTVRERIKHIKIDGQLPCTEV